MQQISQSVTHLKPLDLWASAAANAAILPLDLPIEEEKKQNYDPKQFYPVKLGEIFHDKYQVVVKVGFGGHSTVWLARNLHRFKERYAILKVSTHNTGHTKEALHELRISRQIANKLPPQALAILG